MKFRLVVWLCLGVVAGLLMAGCAAQQPEVVEKVVTQIVEKEVTKIVEETVILEGTPQIVEKVVTQIVEVAPTPIPSEIKRGGVIKISISAEPESFNSNEYTSMTAYILNELVNESLLKYDTSMEAVPSLAETYTISDDGLEWTFYLRKDVTWHNGDPFTAADVEYTFNLIKDPDNPHRLAQHFIDVESMEVIDDYTVVWHLSQPNSVLIQLLPDVFRILHQSWVEEMGGDISRSMMGTGPWVFKEWIPDQVIRFERNPNYYLMGEDGQALPYMDGIDVVISPDATARIVDFLSGVTDMVQRVPNEEIDRLASEPNVVLAGPESMRHVGVYFTLTNPPFDDKRVRQAISWAIDREEIAKVGLLDKARPAPGGAFPEWFWAYTGVEVYTHQDLDKAKELLAEAGYPNGEGFPEVVIKAPSSGPDLVTVAEMVAAYMQELGIDARGEGEEAGVWREERKNGDLSIYVSGWFSSPDPDEPYSAMFSSQSATNYFKYDNPKLDDLLSQARSVSDKKKRIALYTQIESILMEDVPQAYVAITDLYDAHHTDVRGFTHTGMMNWFTLAETWLDR